MSTDLKYLVLSATLTLVLVFPGLLGRMFLTKGGFMWIFNSRGEKLEVAPWISRADRAHSNMIENIAVFAILVLVAHVLGKANAMTALGATIFFWARVAHALIYIGGLPFVRTLAYLAGVAGNVLILVQVLG